MKNTDKKTPIPAWRIFNTGYKEPKASTLWMIQRCTVFAVQGERAWIEYLWSPSAPPKRMEVPISELASTREKALRKLDEILTAQESRPPLPNSGLGQPPKGMTDSGADNHNRQPAAAIAGTLSPA